MPANMGVPWLRRTNEKRARVWRALRRSYHQRIEKKPYDLDRIDNDFVAALYRETAAKLGLDVHEKGRVVCIEGRGKMFHVWQTTTELDHFPSYAITEDKVLTKKLFKESGFAVPEGRVFAWQDHSAGVAYALSLGCPCVIKPAMETSGGKGISTRLSERADIARAFRYAGLFSHQVLVEEFLAGDCYRFLVYKGRCLSVLRRDLPTVTGNGVSTVKELAEEENRNRRISPDWQPGDPLSIPVPVDSAALRHLRRQGLGWKSVPAPGQKVHMAGASNLPFGATLTEVLHQTHPDLLRVAEQATNSLGLQIAGVDIIATDIAAAACHILEINIAPGTKIHYMLTNPDEAADPIRTILADYFEIDQPNSA